MVLGPFLVEKWACLTATRRRDGVLPRMLARPKIDRVPKQNQRRSVRAHGVAHSEAGQEPVGRARGE
jgi:hypothetical protein